MTSQPELQLAPSKPTELITHTSAEFFALCARADQLELVDGKWRVTRPGEFAIESVSRVTGRNSARSFRVRWSDSSLTPPASRL